MPLSFANFVYLKQSAPMVKTAQPTSILKILGTQTINRRELKT